MDMEQLRKDIEAIDIEKETNKRDGYTQVFKEKGSELTHFLIRDSDGKKSKPVGYTRVSGIDGYYSVSAYYRGKEAIQTAEEFMKEWAE